MLSAETSFKLIGRVVKLLADNFQFNELSENGYLQGYKVCYSSIRQVPDLTIYS